MASSRVATAVVGLLAGLLLSILLWRVFGSPVFFLFVPFVPFLFRGRGEEPTQPPVRSCPRCGFQTMDQEFEYCPRDGARLETRDR